MKRINRQATIVNIENLMDKIVYRSPDDEAAAAYSAELFSCIEELKYNDDDQEVYDYLDGLCTLSVIEYKD